MAPIAPHWHQPSHPDIQSVISSPTDFASKSLSKVALPPFAVFAKLEFPPCTLAGKATYASVQMGPNRHLDLNSDLLYINHSCDPSLIFDMGNLNILVGPKGLQPGDELTFFYPSTEWDMAQSFDCLCGSPVCRGTISGAKNMSPKQLEGAWLNGHIHKLLDQQQQARRPLDHDAGPGREPVGADPTARALREALAQAEKVVEAARLALGSYLDAAGHGVMPAQAPARERRGPTSRELSGEMGGDTLVAQARG